MKRKIFFISLSFFLFFAEAYDKQKTLLPGIYYTQSIEQLKLRAEHEEIKIILLDLHKVMLQMKKFKAVLYMLKCIIKDLNVLSVIRGVSKRYKNSSNVEKHTLEGILEHYMKDNPSHIKYLEEYYKIANMQTVNSKMLTLLKNLKEQNKIIIIITSNIGESTLEFAHKLDLFSELFKLTDGYAIAHINHEKNKYLAKPDPEFFEHVLKAIQLFYSGPTEEKIFLLDDEYENCAIARSFKIESYEFDGNIKKLKEWLKTKKFKV